jgi:predicted MPP superfamily phosphohydrolase
MTAFLVALFVVVPLYHAYIGARLLPDLPLGTAGTALAIALLAASSLLIPLAMLSRRMARPVTARLAWVGFIAMGVFSNLIVLTILRDLVLLVMVAAGFTFGLAVIDRWLLDFLHASALGAPAVAVAMSAIGYPAARRRAAVRETEVRIPGLPAALDGFAIAQITDVHIGATIRRPYVEAIVDAVNALGADLIAVTGDLVDGTVDQLRHDAAPLARLAARHGAFFVTGNHEYYSGVHGWLDELRRLGLAPLINEHRVIVHGDATLVLAGITDFTAHHFDRDHKSDPARAVAGAPADAGATILLAHQPRSAFAATATNCHLQISGHTHGGQFWPWPWFVRLQQPFTAGLHRMGALKVYVSRGTGYWGPPMRIGAPSEISLLRLRRAHGTEI